MASKMKTSNLTEVKPFKYGWSVAVKVIHSFISFSHQFGATLEMVLADKDGVKIHATCKQSLLQRFESQCVVGEWKLINNFALRSACGVFRPTNHVYKMEFMSQTSITDCDFIAEDNMFLDLLDLPTIINGRQDSRFLIDVIGVILHFEDHTVDHVARKEVAKVLFTLADMNDNLLPCCISGKLAQVLAEEVKPKNGDICLIRFAKIGIYNDEWRVYNAFGYTLVFINPDIKDAQSLKQKFSADEIEKRQPSAHKMEIQEKRKKWSQFPFKSIQEMKHCEKGENCRVICSVYAVDTLDGWWYCACVICQNKVFRQHVSFGDIDAPSWWLFIFKLVF